MKNVVIAAVVVVVVVIVLVAGMAHHNATERAASNAKVPMGFPGGPAAAKGNPMDYTKLPAGVLPPGPPPGTRLTH